MVEVSVIIPVKNEEGNIENLVNDILLHCEKHKSIEIIIVNDNSDDDSIKICSRLMKNNNNIRLLQHDRNAGQSAAIHNGVLNALAEIICTLDGDGQNPPEELPRLFLPFFDENCSPELALVAGRRINRRDSVSKRLASWFANELRSRLLKDNMRDTGCGLKAFKKNIYLSLPYFNHMHRYLAALFRRDGWDIVTVNVKHRPRVAGVSKYTNFQRGLVGVVDLLGVIWLLRRKKMTTAKIFHSEDLDA